MRTSVLALAATAFASAFAAPARADTAADIAAIEQAWGRAFLDGNRAYIEALVAPEFKLMHAGAPAADFTPRAEWLANAGRFIFHEYEVRTVDVVAAGDTAVATVEGRWKVGMQGREGTRDQRFLLSDTFVRRGGQWQVIYRHSTPFPAANPAPAPGTERGR